MFRPVVGVFLIVAAPHLAAAQPGIITPRAILNGESQRVSNRLRALDRQMSPLPSAREVAGFVAWCGPAGPLRATVSAVLEANAAEKWEQILDEVQKLIEEDGDALAPGEVKSTGADIAPPSVNARLEVHRRIAALPRSLLERYRRRVDAQAKKLLDEGVAERNATLLRKLVDETFCSRYGDQALDYLGDLAFERGDFEDALAWWQMLVAPPGQEERSAGLLFPDSHLDLARIQAKEVLAYAFLNQIDRAEHELTAFRRLQPQAHGSLAGNDGPFAATLATWIDKLRVNNPISNLAPWTTFAGNSSRNRVLAVLPPARLWVDGATWRVPLPGRERPVVPEGEPRARAAGNVEFHPLIVDNQVLIADARSVLSYDLFTGRKLFHFTLKDAGAQRGLKVGNAQHSGHRFTLTAWNRRVFARLGRQSLAPAPAEDKEVSTSTLVCLDEKGEAVWQIAASTPASIGRFFEGAPLVEDGRVYSALSWLEGQSTHTALACFDAGTGKRLWWREVCTTPEFEYAADPRTRQHLLTLGGGRLYYCAHAGAVVAVDPWTGKSLWGVRYLSRGPKTEEGFPSPRDLAPCIYADGRLYLAPLDTKQLFCLDAGTGRLLWEYGGIEIVQMLGVVGNRVYFTTPRGLRCLVASKADGASHNQAGWVQPAEGSLPGTGRGLLAGSWLLWPTQDPKLPLRGVTLHDGYQERFNIDKAAPTEPEYLEPTMLRAILPGNMAFGQNCLVVAGQDELAVYVPQRHFLEDRKKMLQDARDPRLVLYQLAMAQNDAGLGEAARQNFERLGDLTKNSLGSNGAWNSLSRQRIDEMLGRSPPPWRQTLMTTASLAGDCQSPISTPVPVLLPLQKLMEVATQPARSAASVTRYCLQDSQPTELAEPTPRFVGCNKQLRLFMADQRLLLARDLQSGQVAWSLWASGGQIQPLHGGGRFGPHVHVGDRLVLLQTNAGKYLVLDSATGKLLRQGPAPVPWPRPPLAVDDHRFVVPADDGKVLLLNAASGQIVWTYQPMGLTSLTGSPTQIFGTKDQVLALVSRNIGPELVRLSSDRGSAYWRVPFLPDAVVADNAALDEVAAYFACGDVLQARSLRDGALIWRQPLVAGAGAEARSMGGWRCVRAGDALLVCLTGQVSIPWIMPLVCPFSRPLGYFSHAKTEPDRSVLIFDPRSGQCMQRLPLAEDSPLISLEVRDNCLRVQTRQKIYHFGQGG